MRLGTLKSMKVPQKALLMAVIPAFYLAVITGSMSLGSEVVRGIDDPIDVAPKFASHGTHNRASSLTLEKDRVRNLCGMAVENRDGQSLGRLENFVVDLQSGRVIYALLSSGGILGIHKHLKVVPPQLLSAATAKKGILALDVGHKRWQHAPYFKMTELAVIGLPAEKERIYAYYGQPSKLSDSPQAAMASATVQKPGKLDRSRTVAIKAQLEFATAVIGKNLLDRKQGLIGEVADLLVDVKGGKPSLVLISPNRLWKEHGNFAVSVAMLRRKGSDTWSIDVTREMLAAAPSLNEQSWQTTDSSARSVIYRYSEGDLREFNRSASEQGQSRSASSA